MPMLSAASPGKSVLSGNDLAGLQIVRLKKTRKPLSPKLAEEWAKARAEADVLEREIATDAATIIDRFIGHF